MIKSNSYLTENTEYIYNKDCSVNSVREIGSVNCENHNKHINILYEQNAEMLNVTAFGTLRNHDASKLKRYKGVFYFSRTQLGNLLQFNYCE
jgi:hypothetical protein